MTKSYLCVFEVYSWHLQTVQEGLKQVQEARGCVGKGWAEAGQREEQGDLLCLPQGTGR
jgi:hypothetical protein